jgi:NADPH2:quinone reductase
MSETATAVRIREPGDLDVLEVSEVIVRAPGPGEVLVEVAAAGLNRADIMQRKGYYPAPPGYPADVPGLEFAGSVVALGEGVREWSVGDRVMAITGGGAMCTRVVAHARELMPVPEGMPLVEAAAIPEVFLTAWDALLSQAALAVGEVALIHAAASGVGTAAAQLCRATSARAIGTVRSAEKLDRILALGFSEGIVVRDGRFSADVDRVTGGRGVDVVLDPVGASYLEDNLQAMAPLGRLVLIAFMGGMHAEVPLAPILMKRLRILGTTLRARPLEEKARVAREFSRAVLPLFARGVLKPVVDAVLPMSQVRDAHARMERNETLGKIVLAW